MRTTGIVNSVLAGHLCRLRHTDRFAVVDSGLPVPAAVAVVDLAVVYGIPSFADVLDPVLCEVAVESACTSVEVEHANPDVHRRLARLPGLELLPHEEFKSRVAGASFVVRTGEATPYANVLLTAAVPW